MLPPSLSFSSVSTAKMYSVSYCYVCGLTFMRDKKSSLHLGQWWVFIFTDTVAVLLHCSTVDTAGTFQAALVSLSACVVVECKGFKSHAGRVWQNFKWVIMVQIFKQLFGGIIHLQAYSCLQLEKGCRWLRHRWKGRSVFRP